MPLDSAADIDAALQEAGVPVVSAGSSTFGILDESSALEMLGLSNVSRGETSVVIRTGTITDYEDLMPLTVDGRSFEARTLDPIDDGELSRVTLVPRGS
jgi:hypothetical protein